MMMMMMGGARENMVRMLMPTLRFQGQTAPLIGNKAPVQDHFGMCRARAMNETNHDDDDND